MTCLDNRKVAVAPSILAADFAALGDEIRKAEEAGAQIIHVDVMDGHFVPNLTIGPPVVKSARRVSALPFDVHLMLSNPLPFVKPFSEAGADHITFHIECLDDIEETIREIRRCGCSVGISFKPKTSHEDLFPYLEMIDLVLVMSVEPGFGGQQFMSEMMPKTMGIRRRIHALGLRPHVEIDGGIDENTVSIAAANGANLMVAGTYVFRNPNGPEYAINRIMASQKDLDMALAQIT